MANKPWFQMSLNNKSIKNSPRSKYNNNRIIKMVNHYLKKYVKKQCHPLFGYKNEIINTFKTYQWKQDDLNNMKNDEFVQLLSRSLGIHKNNENIHHLIPLHHVHPNHQMFQH